MPTKPTSQDGSKRPKLDLSDLETGMAQNYAERVGAEVKKHIGESLGTKNGDKNVVKSPQNISGLSGKLERQMQKAKGRQGVIKIQMDEIREQQKEDLRDTKATKEIPKIPHGTSIFPPFEELLEKSMGGNEKANLIKKVEKKEAGDSVDMAKRAQELHEELVFIDKHRDTLIKRIRREKNPSEIVDLERKIDLAQERIDILDKARRFFLNPTKENTLTREEQMEAVEVEKEVLRRMAQVAEEKKLNKVSQKEVQKTKTPEKEKSFEQKFKEFETYIEKLGGIQGSTQWFSSEELKGRLYLIKAGTLGTAYMPAVGGLRNMAEELFSKGGETKQAPKIPVQAEIKSEKKPVVAENLKNVLPETEKPIEKMVENVTPKAEEVVAEVKPEINKEAKDKEEGLRSEIQKIFVEKMEEVRAKIESARNLYAKEIKIKVQHEHAQTGIRSLMSFFARPFVKKTSTNEEEYLKTEKEYEEALKMLIVIPKDLELSDKATQKALEFGDRGLEILSEEKSKIVEMVMRDVIAERKKIAGLREDALPKKTSGMIKKMTQEYKKKSGVSEEGKVSFTKDALEIIGINKKENAR